MMWKTPYLKVMRQSMTLIPQWCNLVKSLPISTAWKCPNCGCVNRRQMSTKSAKVKIELPIDSVKRSPQDDITKSSVKLTHPSVLENTDIDSKNNNNNVLIFLKKSNKVVEVSLGNKVENVDELIPKLKDMVEVGLQGALKERLQNVNVIEQQEANQDVDNLHSIEELKWHEQKVDPDKLLGIYLKLSKIRLTGLVVITTMAGYAVAPGVFDARVFALCLLGTALTSCSANAFNQFIEVPYDAQMNRTKNRVLVQGLISPLHAFIFGTTAGLSGITVLLLGVNTLTAALGAFNLLLYALVYTPMKRYSMASTWLGSIVGAIPPMMGWTAASQVLSPGAFLLGAILYAWQFPHFNSLSWNLRADYSRGGYRMSAVVNPALCKRVAFRYCFVMVGLCTMAPVLDITTWTFAVDSLPLNMYLIYLGWKFYRNGDSKSSRKLFRFSLIHIPVLLVLMLISKKSYSGKKTESNVNWKELESIFREPLKHLYPYLPGKH